MKQPVFLRIYSNGKLETVKQFTEDQIVIGRNTDVLLPLAGEGIAPIHAVIEERDSGYYISDLGSQAGTFKNGKKVFDESVFSGDELQIGSYKIEFFIGVPKPIHAPKSDNVTPLEKAGPPAPPTRTPTAMPTPPPIDRPKKAADKKEAAGKKDDAVSYKPAKTVYSPPSAGGSGGGSGSGSGGDITDSMKKSKGTIVEVVVAWRDRVLGTYHFKERGAVTIGSDENSTIVIPLIGTTRTQHKLLDLGNTIKVLFTQEMNGDLYKDEQGQPLAELKRKNRIIQTATGFELDLMQGEMIRLGLFGDVMSIYVRFIPETPAPVAGPIFDLTASESTAVLMSAVIAAIFGLYMLIYSPKALEDEAKLEEPIRKAVVTFNMPKKEIVEVAETETTPQEKKIVKVDMKAKQQTTRKDPGKAAEIRPSPTKQVAKSISQSVDKGASVKTGAKAANAQSETKDVTKLGLLSTFGGKGRNSELSKAYQGTGELLGEAEKATGYSGSDEERAGDKLGGRLKNVGGGKGSATVGISGVGTSGKGTGTFGTGTGGIGKKGKVDLNIGDSEAEFSGSIDREAIRKVIRDNIKQFENCYNLALRRNSDAYGKVEIRWYIKEGGRASNAKVKSNSVNDKPMGDCIARVITGLTFPEPPPDQIAEVTYPFVFASQ